MQPNQIPGLTKFSLLVFVFSENNSLILFETVSIIFHDFPWKHVIVAVVITVHFLKGMLWFKFDFGLKLFKPAGFLIPFLSGYDNNENERKQQ